MQDIILSYLKSKKKKTLFLTELQKLLPGDTSYEDFAHVVNILENKGILKPIKNHGTNNKAIPLYNSYRVNQTYFKGRLIDEIQSYKLSIHSDLDLQTYITLDERIWKQDLPYIMKLDTYLKENGFPKEVAAAPERSYQITGDEKWIDEKKGKTILQRLKIWDKLKITYNTDPLMLAINPTEYAHNHEHIHLIVENKATYYDCLPFLAETCLTTLIYGAGWKIVSNIQQLERQIGLEDQHHILYYFGDLDHEGLSIWYALEAQRKVVPAVDFYEKLLQKPRTKGKANQKPNADSIQSFVSYFSEEVGKKIQELLKEGYYYPQEGLDKHDIQELWRHIQWRKELEQ